MYNLTILQILQAQAKLSNTPVLMLIYDGPSNVNEKHNQLDKSIKEEGIWYWIYKNTSPEIFSKLRMSACLNNELFLFDINNPSILSTITNTTDWKTTLINNDGSIV